MKNKLEVCIDSLESGINAQSGGADRVELCDNLYEGGTTPSIGMIKVMREKLSIKLNVIIRPRGGDFLYSEEEFEVMKANILTVKEAGGDGVVIGLLLPDGEIDIERTKELVELARPMSVTFHRAFDMTPDPFKALDEIISTGADRLLTSGQQNMVPDGVELVKELVRYSDGRIIIMPGAGINANNIAEIAGKTEVTECHITGRSIMESGMKYRKDGIYFGGLAEIPEFTRLVADVEKVQKMKDIFNSLSPQGFAN